MTSHCQSTPDDTDSQIVLNALTALVTSLEKRVFSQIALKSQSIQFCLDLLKAFCYHNQGTVHNQLTLIHYFMDKYVISQFTASALVTTLLPILSYKTQMTR